MSRKLDCAYLYNRILSRNKNKQTIYTQKSIDESLDYHPEQKKPQPTETCAVKIRLQNLLGTPIKMCGLILANSRH